MLLVHCPNALQTSPATEIRGSEHTQQDPCALLGDSNPQALDYLRA